MNLRKALFNRTDIIDIVFFQLHSHNENDVIYHPLSISVNPHGLKEFECQIEISVQLGEYVSRHMVWKTVDLLEAFCMGTERENGVIRAGDFNWRSYGVTRP